MFYLREKESQKLIIFFFEQKNLLFLFIKKSMNDIFQNKYLLVIKTHEAAKVIQIIF